MTSLANALVSILAAAASGPKTAIPYSRSTSPTPATRGASGPMTTRSAPRCRASRVTSLGSVAVTSWTIASSAMPGLPGAACRSLTPGSMLSARTIACSRPPPPIIEYSHVAAAYTHLTIRPPPAAAPPRRSAPRAPPPPRPAPPPLPGVVGRDLTVAGSGRLTDHQHRQRVQVWTPAMPERWCGPKIVCGKRAAHANAAHLMRHRGTGSHCRLLRAPGHRAGEPPGVALRRPWRRHDRVRKTGKWRVNRT